MNFFSQKHDFGFWIIIKNQFVELDDFDSLQNASNKFAVEIRFLKIIFKVIQKCLRNSIAQHILSNTGETFPSKKKRRNNLKFPLQIKNTIKNLKKRDGIIDSICFILVQIFLGADIVGKKL